jgi:hypothetical protein
MVICFPTNGTVFGKTSVIFGNGTFRVNAEFERTVAIEKRWSALVQRTVKWNWWSRSEATSLTPSMAISKIRSNCPKVAVSFAGIAIDASDESSTQVTGDVGGVRSLSINELRSSQLVRFGRQNTDCTPGRPLLLAITAGGPSHSVLFPVSIALSGTSEQSALNQPLSQRQASSFWSHCPWPEHPFKEQYEGIAGACETASNLGIVDETGSRGACE